MAASQRRTAAGLSKRHWPCTRSPTAIEMPPSTSMTAEIRPDRSDHPRRTPAFGPRNGGSWRNSSMAVALVNPCGLDLEHHVALLDVIVRSKRRAMRGDGLVDRAGLELRAPCENARRVLRPLSSSNVPGCAFDRMPERRARGVERGIDDSSRRARSPRGVCGARRRAVPPRAMRNGANSASRYSILRPLTSATAPPRRAATLRPAGV